MHAQEVQLNIYAKHMRPGTVSAAGRGCGVGPGLSVCPPPHQESPPFVDTLSTLGPPSDPAPLASHRPVRASGGQRPTCCRGWAPRKSTVLGLPAVRAGPVPGPDNDCLQKPWLLLPGLARNIRAFPFTLPAHWPEECRRPARGSQWAPGSRTEWESGAGQKACW